MAGQRLTGEQRLQVVERAIELLDQDRPGYRFPDRRVMADAEKEVRKLHGLPEPTRRTDHW